ncbi:hypothetical protein ACCO45_007571 [Purpureocillium lilacinum]|uniref:Uncharacterized protein n=1 Tax=Purpureocillium lilacinum TaxID=33203 RepID=A0ACC4DU40_PURLI
MAASSAKSLDESPGALNPKTVAEGSDQEILVVGLCAFCAPGIWSAMNGLGVGGSQSPNLVNAANALLYAFMTVTCFAGPWVTNAIGFRYTLSLGSIGYPLYAAGLYLNNRTGATWLVYLGSVTCGISAGFFWSVEGAIATGYPEQHKRGRYIATWFTFRNFGNIIGGAISLRSTTPWTNPVRSEKVQRDDGTRIETSTAPIHWRTELQSMYDRIRSRSILLLTPLFWYFGWIQAYPGTYLATYFTVRSRALGSFMSAIVGTLATWLGVHWWTFLGPETENWGDQSTFGRGFGLYLFERISLGMVENYIYWCIGNLSDSPGEQIRYSSLLRGIETAGVAVGFGVQAVPTALIATASINFGLWFFALPFSFWATLQVVKKWDQEQNRQVESS